jgi:hypothetical protein
MKRLAAHPLTRLLVRSFFAAVAAVVAAAFVASCAMLAPAAPDEGDAPAQSPPADADRPEAESPEAERPGADEPADEPTTEPDRARTDGYRLLEAGQHAAVRIPLARAITSPDLWADFWSALNANDPDGPERPEVDFDEETVIVLLLGERPTGGYAVRIDEVIERRTEVVVVVAVERPEPGEMVTQALTAPYLVATIPMIGKPVEFAGDDVEEGFVTD